MLWSAILFQYNFFKIKPITYEFNFLLCTSLQTKNINVTDENINFTIRNFHVEKIQFAIRILFISITHNILKV